MIPFEIDTQKRALGITQIVCSGICYGFLGLFGKLLYEKGVRPGELLALRFSLAAGLGIVYRYARSTQKIKLSWKQVMSCIMLGTFGYALMSLFFFTALTGLSASLSVLLLYTYPVLVALAAWVFLGEKIPRQHWLAFPLAAAGLVAIVWGDFTIARSEYLFFAVGSACVYAFYILASSRWLKGVDPLVSTPLIQASSGIALSCVFLRDGPRTLAILETSWWIIVLVAFVCTVMAMGLFMAGLQKLKNWEVSVLSITEPLTGVVVGIAVLGDKLTGRHVIGAGAILLALVWISRPVAIMES
ncbi:MAG: DMT family transporter [Chitinophagaceae bacterium]|nr:DMT family transporter [Oligoflexus sp.]